MSFAAFRRWKAHGTSVHSGQVLLGVTPSIDGLAGVVLAAGAGTRLRPLTALRPKALCPVGTVPLLDLALARLAPLTGCGESGPGRERARLRGGRRRARRGPRARLRGARRGARHRRGARGPAATGSTAGTSPSPTRTPTCRAAWARWPRAGTPPARGCSAPTGGRLRGLPVGAPRPAVRRRVPACVARRRAARADADGPVRGALAGGAGGRAARAGDARRGGRRRRGDRLRHARGLPGREPARERRGERGRPVRAGRGAGWSGASCGTARTSGRASTSSTPSAPAPATPP